MTTNNNPRFETFYRKITRHLGITSQTELAARLGVNRSAITQAKHNDSVPDAWVLKLAEAFDVDPFWLKTGATGDPPPFSEKRQLVTIPRVHARLHAGGGSFEVDQAVASHHAFDRGWLRRRGSPARMVLMDVIGDSMSPVIEEGDTVLIDQSQKTVYAGRIYAVGIDDTVLVKRLEKHPQKLVLLSANSAYQPLHVDPEAAEGVRIIGRVIWICRELP